MSKENNIRKGMLSEKMGNFQVEPPESAWENISSQLHSGRSRRVLFIALAAAAGLALAITVGVSLLEKEETVREQVVVVQEQESETKTTSSPELQTESSLPSRLEEKVLIAMEEVIQEMEETGAVDPDEVIVAENIEVTQDIEADNQQDIALDDQQDIALDDQQDIDSEEQEELASDDQLDTGSGDQHVIDSVYSERYIDSLANAVIPDHEIIVDNEKEKKKWQVGASLTPLFSYRDASSTDQLQNKAANESESGILKYSGGVQIRYAQSDRLTFESGLYYNKMGLAIGDFRAFRSELDFLVGDNMYTDNSIVSMSNSIGTIASLSEDVFVNAWAGSATDRYSSLDSKEIILENEVVNSFVQSLNYLEIPFNVKYKVLDRNLKVLLIGGLSTNLLVGNQVFANTDNGKIDYGSIQDIRTVNYSGNAGLGFVYEFSGNFSLSLEPRFKYYLNSINSSSLPATRPYTLGVYTGVNYSF